MLFLREGSEADVLQHLRNLLGDRAILRSEELTDESLLGDQLASDALVLFSQLGIAVVRAETTRADALRSLAAGDGPVEEVVAVEPVGLEELLVSPEQAESPPESREESPYLRGYRDAVNNLARMARVPLDLERLMAGERGAPTEYSDDDRGTWGLHATGVLDSRYTGREVRVAALVDGLDLTHPDWTGRQVVFKSFVSGEPPAAAGPSGMHYLGTVLGVQHPLAGPRYGCAPDAVPYVAKVLTSRGTGSRFALFAALEWALANQCRVILVPLAWGGPAQDELFERVTSRVAERGALLVAGAGQNARRSRGEYGYLMNPAACPLVLGVGSVDSRLQLPDWTPRGSLAIGSTLALVAPGVDLLSSVPLPQEYARFSGSATAAAYVAGIAALWAEAQPQASGRELWQTLIAHARPLTLPTLDVGAGLVQAPGGEIDV